MENISDDLLEDLMKYNNEINCVNETLSSVQDSQLTVLCNTENGTTIGDLVEPLEKLFDISTKKPHLEVDYVRQRDVPLTVNIGENCNHVNVYDLRSFLQALVPNQVSLIRLLEEQCNVHPMFMSLVDKLHLLNTKCTRDFCQGRILAKTVFAPNDQSEISFSIAHPPFVYEIFDLVKQDDEELIENYLKHLRRYLSSKIEMDSCLLCLTYDLYCTDKTDMKGFRLFFLETRSVPDEPSLEYLYETKIETVNKVEQCYLFDVVLHNITLSCLEGENHALRYWNDKKQEAELYF